jgi:hypothetical protein
MSNSMDHTTDPQTEFYIVPKVIYDDASLSPSARLLYGAIMYAARNPENRGWRTNASYAEQFSKHERSVTTWVSELEEAGYILIDTVLKSSSNEVYRRYITPHVIMGQVDGRTKLPKDKEGRRKEPKDVEENYAGKNNIKKNNTIGDESPKEAIKEKAKDNYSFLGSTYIKDEIPTVEQLIVFYRLTGNGLNCKSNAEYFHAYWLERDWKRGRKSIQWPKTLNTWIKASKSRGR